MGAATDVKVITTLVPEFAVASLSDTTDPVKAITYVSELIPTADTTLPIEMPAELATVISVTEVANDAVVVVTIPLVKYVGNNVGLKVGLLVGDFVGPGVGSLTAYDGDKVGEIVGVLLGTALGFGVGFP